MTRSEAIKILWQYDVNFEPHPAEDVMHAIDMAIEALEQEQERQEDIYECPNCLGEVHINYIYCPFCGIRMESEEE